MAPNFSHLLRKPMAEIKRPKALPEGVYPSIVKAYAFGESSQKKTPYVRFTLGILGWPDEVDETDRFDDEGKPIKIAGKETRIDYYLTDDALFMLKETLEKGFPGDERTLEELVPAFVGTEVGASITQRMDERTNAIFAECRNILVGTDLVAHAERNAA